MNEVDRRLSGQGRRTDDKSTCLWHGDGIKRMENLEVTIDTLNRKILGMTRLIYTGVGIALCGAALITIIFTSFGAFKSEVRADIGTHEVRLERQYDSMHDELVVIGNMVRDLHAERKIRSAIEEAIRGDDKHFEDLQIYKETKGEG